MKHNKLSMRISAVIWPILSACFASSALAQDSCQDTGSHLVDGFWEHGPPLLCEHQPQAPAWKLLTPAHREPVPRAGYRPGRATEIPRVLVRYRCTGFWLFPVVIRDAKILGYVFDVGQRRCR